MEKALNYGKFFSEWRNKEVNGEKRGNPKNSGEFDNMMDDWRQTDDYKMQMPDYISKLTIDFGRTLLQNDLERVNRGEVPIYETEINADGKKKLTEAGTAKWLADINRRIPRTSLNKILGKQNIQELLNKARED